MKISSLVSVANKLAAVSSVEVAPAISSENEARRRRLVAGYDSLKGCIVLKGVTLSRIQREEVGALVYRALKTACAAYGAQAACHLGRALPAVARWARQYGFRARIIAGQIHIWSVRKNTARAVTTTIAKGLRQLAEKAAALAAVKAEISAKVEEVRKGLFRKQITVKGGKKGLEKVLFGLDRNGIPVLSVGEELCF